MVFLLAAQLVLGRKAGFYQQKLFGVFGPKLLQIEAFGFLQVEAFSRWIPLLADGERRPTRRL